MTTSLLPSKQLLTRAPLWHVIDVRGLRVGHAATHISRLLIGKHKPSFNPAVDGGDYVVVTNADKVTLTGDKWKKKLYRWHTGYPGGLKEVKAQDMLYKHPDSLIRRAVSKMLPKNKLRWDRLKRLRVFVGEEHPHEQQVSRGSHYTIVPPPPPKGVFEDDPALAAFYEKAKADPEAFAKKYGGAKISINPTTLAIETSKIKGSHTNVVRTYGNSRSLRAARLDRLRKVVEGIQATQAKEVAKRDPL